MRTTIVCVAMVLQAIDPDKAAFRAFDAAVARYLTLQQKLLTEVAGLAPNSSAKELNDASDRLAAAIRRARPKAREGDFFDPEATRVIRQRISDALRAPGSTVAIESIDDEAAPTIRPAIHLRFPEGLEMATMPPSILSLLPPLPSELEYRIIGEYLVLRDVGGALILDFIPGAVPRKKQ
jgi:hypothetical protein